MDEAIELARRAEGRTAPNPPVGAIILREGLIIGRGFHPQAGRPHAEVFALEEAGEKARGADLYVTLEPCSHFGKTPPCTEAIIRAGIRRVFVGCVDPNPLVSGRGLEKLREAGIEVYCGLREIETRGLIEPFAHHIRTGRPFTTFKSAISLDGRIATSSGESQWISCEESRRHAHHLRNRVDAMMVGIGTVLEDDPRLSCRIEGGRDPVRVVVDSQLRTPPEAAMLTQDSEAPTLIATLETSPVRKVEKLQRAGAEILQFKPDASGRVDLDALWRELGRRNLQHLLLEGGGTLSHSALRGGLINRILFYLAPMLMGGDDAPGMFRGPAIRRLEDAFRLENLRMEALGRDMMLVGEVASCSRD